MATIESIISKLNKLCRQFIVQKEQFNEYDRIRELYTAIKELGYNISWPHFTLSAPEYELLSDEGKHDLERLSDIRKMKLEAVKDSNFERVADLRDLERELIIKIGMDFSMKTKNQHFILAGKPPELVIFNDPDSLLITLFK